MAGSENKKEYKVGKLAALANVGLGTVVTIRNSGSCRYRRVLSMAGRASIRKPNYIVCC